jgi:hypothetical protein
MTYSVCVAIVALSSVKLNVSVFHYDGQGHLATPPRRATGLGKQALCPSPHGTFPAESGKGGNYPQGSSLHTETMKLPTGEMRNLDPVHAKLTPVSHEGEVACLLLNPHAVLGGFILKGQHAHPFQGNRSQSAIHGGREDSSRLSEPERPSPSAKKSPYR